MTMPPQPQPTSSSRIPGLQPELAADQVELLRLRLLQRRVRLGVARRRCTPSTDRGPAVEGVRDVVVVADGRGVARLGVPPAAAQRRWGLSRPGRGAQHVGPSARRISARSGQVMSCRIEPTRMLSAA